MKTPVRRIAWFLSVTVLVCLAMSCAITRGGDLDSRPKPTDTSALTPASEVKSTPEPTLSPTADPMAALAWVCQGTPVPEAAEYRTENVPHHIYFFSSSNEGLDWNSQVPPDWLAKSVSETDLVGCLTEQETVIETCSYLPTGSADRYQYDTTVRLVAAKSAKEIHAPTLSGAPPKACPSSMEFDLLSPKRAIIAGGHVTFAEAEGYLALYIESPTLPRAVKSEAELGIAALSADSTMLASVSPSGAISLWDVTTGQLLNAHKEALGFPRSIAFSPDGSRLGIGTFQGVLVLLDVRGKRPAQEISNPERYPVRGVAFSPDGSLLVTLALDQVVLWNATTLRESKRLAGPYPTDVAFSPDGSKLAATGYSGVTIWEVAAIDSNPVVVEEWPEPSDDALSNPFWGKPLAFTPDNQVLVYAVCKQVDSRPCGQAEIRRWNLARGDWSAPLTGPTSLIQQLDVSRDGTTVVATYCKEYSEPDCVVSQISLWDLATGEELHSFGLPGYASGAIFAADSHTLIIVREKELVFLDISWVR